jgi:YcxB-like protein
LTSLSAIREGETREGVLCVEYALTPAERSEARSLILRRQVGGGSKWLTRIILLLALGGMLLAVWAKITEFNKAHRPYAIAAFVALTAVVYVLRRRARKKADSPVHVAVELSAHGIRFVSDQSQSLIPWRAISRRMESDSLLLLKHRTHPAWYIFPKRAFPSPESVNWLREIDLGPDEQPESTETVDAAVPASNHDRSTVTIDVRLSLWNWFDWSLASWALGRGVAILWTGMLIGVWFVASLTPNPNAKLTDGQVFLYFALPASVVGSAVLVSFLTTYSWFTHRKEHGQHTISLGKESVTVATKDGTGTLAWTTFTRYKETPWSFLVWNISPGNWLMLPKSAFPSINALEDCRELLARRLRRSTWFFGR